MSKRIRSQLPVLVAALVAGFAGSAAAGPLACAPLPIAAGDTCDCRVQNYSEAKDDDGVAITLYSLGGPVATCEFVAIPIGQARVCTANFISADTCGCRVDGTASATRVSLSVTNVPGASPFASVACPRRW